MNENQTFKLDGTFDGVLQSIVGDKSPQTQIEVIEGDCRDVLKQLEVNSVHLVLTDPPYFLDGLGDDWDDARIKGSKAKAGVIGGLPVGMKFDRKQGRDFQDFMNPIAAELLRVLVPGGFFVCFSQPRLFHRLAVACEDAGFEIRDLLAWHYTRKAQFKAFSQDHFVKRMKISAREKKQIIRALHGRKTPQLRPQFEAMMLAQKPKVGTFVENWLKWKTGLVDATRTLDGASPATLMTVEKPSKSRFNGHLTVKPVALLSHLIKLLTIPGQIVLDPFLGSGSTAIAARDTERSCIGIEVNTDYITIAEKRLEETKHD